MYVKICIDSNEVTMISIGSYYNTIKSRKIKQSYFTISETFAAASRMTDILYQVCAWLF
jgi:hypothetical protein